MGKGTIKKRIENILEDGPKATDKIMSELKRYRDCPTTCQLSQTLTRFFQQAGEAPSMALGSYHTVKVWTLRGSKQKA